MIGGLGKRGIRITIPKTEITIRDYNEQGHALRNQNPLLRTVLEKNPTGNY